MKMIFEIIEKVKKYMKIGCQIEDLNFELLLVLGLTIEDYPLGLDRNVYVKLIWQLNLVNVLKGIN